MLDDARPGSEPSAHLAPGVVLPGSVPAGRVRRCAAGLVDALLLGAVMEPLTRLAAHPDRGHAVVGGALRHPWEKYDVPLLLAGHAVLLVVGIAYFTILHSGWGQTFGKRLLGIRLMNADGSTTASRRQIVRRAVFVGLVQVAQFMLADLVPFGSLLGLLLLLDSAWILWDQRCQAIHDKVAGTVVVRALPGAPNPYARGRLSPSGA
ncbi:hypothetical protein GCM10009727_73070 [Actinomadura napierensis]|uniref:RDD domain-containing protein n=1 Tax=Actinomadura napierensis TaxID=267854 RepID=A0ABN3ACF4_9ACTN